ncbi:MAG TPA: GTPase ObgE [Anaerolineaceae bacterium]
MFVDEARIYVRSGNGGNGMVHFHREKYVPRGGPDGGDGGRGGDVVFEVASNQNTLAQFRHKTRFIASDGKRGGSNNMTGASAPDLVIYVPPGTVIWDDHSGEMLADLVQVKQRFTVCKGGRGGLGNQHFASPRNQAPQIAEKGEPGQERFLRLELKLIADVGIVGVPNAGKSSLLAAVTNANPKIGDYPFTTLEPVLGVAELDINTVLVLADIPGLIEGAHEGVGLGDAFLKHIQRTRVLIHMLDGLALDPVADYTQVNNELALFDPNLAKKPQVVALNKIDLPQVRERWDEIRRSLEKIGVKPMAVSAMARTDLMPLLWKAVELLDSLPEDKVDQAIPVYRPPDDPRTFQIERVQEGWRVHGAAIERSAAMTYWEYPGSVYRFQRLLNKLGIEDALRKAGIQEGDSVLIGDSELEWWD